MLVGIVILLTFLAGILFIAGAHYGVTKRDVNDSFISHLNLRLLSSPIQTVGSDYLFYHLRCGSSCLGIQLVHLPTGKVYPGVVSYMYDDANQEDYALFTDWHGNDHKLDDLFDRATAIVQGNTVVLTFTRTDKQTIPQNISVSIEINGG